MPGALILINGFPGIGKHAVARYLTTLLPECKFFGTRNLIAAASQLYESDDPAHGYLRKNLKHAIFDSIVKVQSTTTPTGPPPPIYVLTDFLSVAARQMDRDIMHEFIAFAQRSGFAFIHIILSSSTEENVRRLESRRLPLPSPSGSGSGSGRGTSTPTAIDASQLLQVRMEEEIGHIGPMPGLCGEFELETTNMDAQTAAGVLAEYCLDTLRDQGWWIQLNAMGGKQKATNHKSLVESPNLEGSNVALAPTPAPAPAPAPAITVSSVVASETWKDDKPAGSLSAATSKLAGFTLGKKKTRTTSMM